MPQAVGLALFQIGLGGLGTAIAQFGATALGAALFNIGISVGLSALASTFLGQRVQTPKPEDVQQSSKQPTQPRIRHYGRVKTSGPWVFAESKRGDFHKVLALGVGPFDAIEEVWVDDKQVTIDGTGAVKSDPWSTDENSFGSYLKIETRLGDSPETHYSNLEAAFPEWDSNHRGDGIASLYAKQFAVSQERYFKSFSNGVNTNYRVVARASKLIPIGGGTPAWGDNAAAVIYDYLISSDGLRLPAEIVNTPLALQKWSEAFDRANEVVALKVGGTEKRYRLWGSYRLDERPADVLKRMLAGCDGRIIPTSDGGLTLNIGTWEDPSVTIDELMIVAFSDLARGRDVLNTANTITATYTVVDQDYQSSDADPWVDASDISARGEITQDIQLTMVPSHAQARRLMKLTAYRANPNWVGTFQCNLAALAAFGERFVRISYPLFGIDEVFEVQKFDFNFADGETLTGVTLAVQSMPSAAYSWDAAQEEGDAPVGDSATVTDTIPSPTEDGRTFDVTILRKTISGQPVPYGELAFSPSPSAALLIEAQGKRTADTQWNPIAVSEGATSAESFALSDGEEYEFQIRYKTLASVPGDWTASVVITAIGDTTPPDPLTGFTATGGAGTVDLSWTAPNSQNYAAADIYRNTTNDLATATLVRTEYGPQSNMDSWQDSGLAAGDYYYWGKARNASGVESGSVASGLVTVS